MSEYTKGPWKAELGEVYEVRDAEDGRICIITNLRGRHGLGGRRADGESASNARLIAAAPEMLEALKELLDARNRGGSEIVSTHPEYGHSLNREGAAAVRCEEAIAKAEGR